MQKKLKVVCIGMGQRGNAYLGEMAKLKEKYEIVAVCDHNKQRLENAKKIYNLDDTSLFTDEDEFFRINRGDICVVATQDQDHVRHALKALKAGYDILCEKPISNKEDEIRLLLEEKNKTSKRIIVCHVLRYAPAFRKVKELVDNNVVGKLIMIDAIENVGYTHQAHSYVRGNWRKEGETSPMIIAKCCHDLDLLVWYTNSKCESLSSFGDLNYFKKENQPKGASDRCLNCIYKGKCIYDAYDLYIKNQFWGRNMITDSYPVTDEDLEIALDNGPYGRCVFACDNDVVDNQVISMKFKNGVVANLRMTAFTYSGGRIYKFYGTNGEIDLDETNGFIEIKIFGKPKEKLMISTLVDAVSGHGGGDASIITSLYDVLTGKDDKYTSSLETSIESHLMGFAAEESRKKGGEIARIKH